MSLHIALIVLGAFALCLFGVVFLPIRISLRLLLEKDSVMPFRFDVRLWGIRLISIPNGRSRRSNWLGRKLSRWIESLLTPSDKPKPEAKTKPKTAKKPLRPGFLIWAAGRGMNLVSRLTRSLEIRCTGIDPALLGMLTGVAAIAQGAFGIRKFRWYPDFAPAGTRIEIRWGLSISIWKLVVWTGETFSDRNRQHRSRSGFVVSSS